MTAIQIIPAEQQVVPMLLQLYQAVSADPAGLIRQPAEVNEEYVNGFVSESLRNGLILLMTAQERIIGEIHAYTPQLAAFRHILTDLTIVLAPEYQGRGLGKQLFTAFLDRVSSDFAHILRVELYVRESNERNVAFYQRLGFIIEGRHVHKIWVADSKFETPLQMTWFNPAYRNITV
ncbi:GNAT family N-acetyltransferase [Pedobacter yulinensis]|uniref:GNAT family N-acetyltransferase n=1 Tax=Pedobacter yulinensis TaxID=2126353 RepID=A0A2T3HMH1_9SPHI|nr:N-acetyltransferase [Pedobacter yulinensis]PST83635.1 GNAT family N-acetyltransferase [Pedobacter yulinensis]